MMAGIEAALLELLVVIRGLRAEAQEAVQEVLFAALSRCSKRAGRGRMLKIAVAIVAAHMLSDALVLVTQRQPVG